MSDKDVLPSLVGILATAPVLVGSDSATAPASAEDDPGFDDGDALAPAEVDWPLLRRCADEPQNDIGNSRRLRLRHGSGMLHIQNIGWHVYDGQRWKEDVDEAGTRPLCHATVEAIALESYVIEPTEREAAEIEAAGAAREEIKALELEARELDDRDLTPTARKRAKDDVRRTIRDLEPVVERAAGALKAVQARKAQRRRFANTSGNKGKIDGMVAEAIPYLSRPVGELDADPLALNVGNGTLRFVEVEVPDPECPDPAETRMMTVHRVIRTDHAREDLIAKLAECDYDSDADAPLFREFIERILPNEDVRAFVQRWLGYSITALTREQCFCLLHGEGANGKSTLIDLVAKLLGDYATSVPIDTLVNTGGPKKGSEATPDLARLPGARLVRTAEPKEGVAFDEALIKGLTSDEPIPVRRLNAEFIDIYPTFKLNVSANRKPKINGNDEGIWRRVNLIPFEVSIPKDERDKRLPEKLWKERNGVLNWLLAGCLDYLDRGKLDPPAEVLAATQEYRDESDIIAQFISAALNVTRDTLDKVEQGRLYEAFTIFCRRNGTTPIAATTFARRLPKAAAQAGIEKGKASLSIYYGVTIKPTFVPSDAPVRPLMHQPRECGEAGSLPGG